jgi:hypothetical protein
MMQNQPTNSGFNTNKYTLYEVLNDTKLEPFLHEAVLGMCRELEIKNDDANYLIKNIWKASYPTKIINFERCLQKEFAKYVSPKKLRTALDKRAYKITSQIKPFIVGDRIADIGCGDGVISLFLSKKHTLLMDVCDYLDERVNFPLYTSQDSASFDFSFSADTSLLLTVLHHSKDPHALLRETKKITTYRAIVIESVYGINHSNSNPLWNHENSELQKKYATFVDWLYNRVFHDNVPVPYNFASPDKWCEIFKTTGWNLIEKIDLGIDQPIVPEYHVLFIIEPN